MYTFTTSLQIIGINPYIPIPENILKNLFRQAGKDKGYIPVCGKVNGKDYQQTLLKYKGLWRLYINTNILTDSPRRIGEIIEVSIQIDTTDRTIRPHPDFIKALSKHEAAKIVFDKLSPSLQKEIIRYLSFLKTEASVAKNIDRAIGFLMGKNRFIGREKP